MGTRGERHHNYELLATGLPVSILPDVLSAIGRRVLDCALPQSCLLCGIDSPDLLCDACRGDLPTLPQARCPQCAEPTAHGERCGRCLNHPMHFEKTYAVFRYDFPVDRLVHALKYGHQLALGGWFGRRLADSLQEVEADCILPLPLHPERLKERGFNQAAEIARALGALCKMPVRSDLLDRRQATAPQAGLPLDQRHANVRGVFECRHDLTGSRILLVDDVMTSGATLDEAARTLKLHGAERVEVAVVARALRN